MGAAAVKAVKEPRQRQCGKRHGTCCSLASLSQPHTVAPHGSSRHKTALDQKLEYKSRRQYAFSRISRRPTQQIFLCRLHPDGNCRQRVRDQVDKQQMNRGKWQRKACKGGIKDTEDTRHIAGKEKLDGIFNIAVDISAVGSSLDDRGKVIICQYHGRSLL